MKRYFLIFSAMVTALLLCACGAKQAAPVEPSQETPDNEMTIAQLTEEQGEMGERTMALTIQLIENPVLALVEDTEGNTIKLFGLTINGEFTSFEDAKLFLGDTIVITGGHYNEFEGNAEIADAVLVERK